MMPEAKISHSIVKGFCDNWDQNCPIETLLIFQIHHLIEGFALRLAEECNEKDIKLNSVFMCGIAVKTLDAMREALTKGLERYKKEQENEQL